jgi:hypothetical protein
VALPETVTLHFSLYVPVEAKEPVAADVVDERPVKPLGLSIQL